MTELRTALDTQLLSISERAQAWVKRLGSDGVKRLEANITIVLFVTGGAYLAAVVLSGFVMSQMMTSILANRSRLAVRGADTLTAEASISKSSNTRDLTKNIKDRNLFNSEGKFPDEKFGGGASGGGAVFDINAPCKATSLPIDLVGTIYLGDSAKSMATVRDKTYSEADIYRVGDEIYGSDGAIVAAVERETLIINNRGTKECIELNKPDNRDASDGFPSMGSGDFGGSQLKGASGGAEVVLESSYVESELGPGFAKIMDAARFVPNTVDGQVNGFKIFAIKGGSMLSRIGLQNNDVITQVNDTNLRQVDQGFAFYQALQDEKEVRIQFLRGGNTPSNIVVRIK